MLLAHYIESLEPAARREFAHRAGTTDAHLAQLKGGHRRPSAEMAKRLSAASCGVVTLCELRPDIWEEQRA